MLPRSCSVVLALSIAGCAVATDSAPEGSSPAAPAAASRPEVGPPYWVDDGYRDPCVFGEVVVIQGHSLRVPVPCAADELDKGDPLPLEVDALSEIDRPVEEVEAIERSDPAALDAAAELRALEAGLVGQAR